jgi:cytochrome P450
LRRTISRKSASTVTLSGVEIPAGALMSVDLDSAHHDAEAFENPNMFDPTRKGPPSLAFGLGAHACLGAVLARQEASVLLQRLLRNFVVCPAGQSRRMCDSDWCDFETIPITLVPVRS